MALLWGVTPRTIVGTGKIDGLAAIAEKTLVEERLVRKGDVIVAGTPIVSGNDELHEISRNGPAHSGSPAS